MPAKKQSINAKMDWDELDELWAYEYEADYGQFFSAQLPVNNFTKVYKEQLLLIQDLVKDLETYIKTPLLKKEEILQLSTYIKSSNLFSIYSLFVAHKVILEVFVQIEMLKG